MSKESSQEKGAQPGVDNSTPKVRSTSPTINEAFAARRAELLAARRTEFGLARGVNEPDFAPWDGICKLWNIHLPGEPRCNYDLVAHYGDQYPTAPITGCPHCGSSYCD